MCGADSLQEKRAASGKVEPENVAAETAPEDGAMKKPDEPPKPAKDLGNSIKIRAQ